MSHNLFSDIEQDNNPSFYGDQSILQNPYGQQAPLAASSRSPSPKYPEFNKQPKEAIETGEHGGSETSENVSRISPDFNLSHNAGQENPHLKGSPPHKQHSSSHGERIQKEPNTVQSAKGNDAAHLKSQKDPNGTLSHTNKESNHPYTQSYSLSHETLDFPNADLVNNSIFLSNKIAQLLNDPQLSIDVISSEKLLGSSIVVYSVEISTPSSQEPVIVKRRYSEFKSLRDTLLKLFPTLVIPPIPEKHSIFTYLISSIQNAQETTIVEMRIRYFRSFLRDLVFSSDKALRNCALVHKFLDPNYELGWNNAINEPPASLIPKNLLLANPVSPTDQNGLYTLLPAVNGFEFATSGGAKTDSMGSLKRANEDLHKLHRDISVFELKEDSSKKEFAEIAPEKIFADIPVELINYEINFTANIKVLSDANKLNSRSIKNFRLIIGILIELGGNLNNFSLQIHEAGNPDKSLSQLVEKFGSTMDSTFLNFESFLINNVIPDWQEPINQLIQYYVTAVQLIKFYKYKLVQFKLLYRLKFTKFQELASFSSSVESQLQLSSLKNLNIDSPSIHHAIRKIELKQKLQHMRSLSSKKSWYGLFGGNKPSFSLPDDPFATQNQPNAQQVHGSSVTEEADAYRHNEPQTGPQQDFHFQHKLQHIEKELNKLDQLIELVNTDMHKLTKSLSGSLGEFLVRIEKKWLVIILDFIRAGKQFFEENLANWDELRSFIVEGEP